MIEVRCLCGEMLAVEWPTAALPGEPFETGYVEPLTGRPLKDCPGCGRDLEEMREAALEAEMDADDSWGNLVHCGTCRSIGARRAG